MKRFILNPARFRWLDRMPVPAFLRVIPLFSEHQGHHRVIPVPPPRHASSERIACGGLSRGTLPRREPQETRVHLIDRGQDRAPWLTGEMAVLAGELSVPTDEQTLALYRGDYGTKPVERVIA